MISSIRSRNLLAAFVFLIAAPSLAAERRMPGNDALLLNQQAAKCLVQKERDRSEKILAALPQSTEARDAFVGMRLEKCVKNKNVFQVFTLGVNAHFTRGAIAEHLLRRDFSSVGSPTGKRISPVFRMPAGDELRTLPKDQRAEIAMVAFGECVVTAEPAKSFSVFETRVGSTDEKSSIAALSTAFASCIPASEKLELKVPDLRSFLAEGAYRVSASKVGGIPNA